jgi:hypothetical protein
LDASSRNGVHNAHFRIRIAQPTITTAYLAFPASSSLAGRAGGADSRTGNHNFPRSGR